jgi:hypothetical protein
VPHPAVGKAVPLAGAAVAGAPPSAGPAAPQRPLQSESADQGSLADPRSGNSGTLGSAAFPPLRSPTFNGLTYLSALPRVDNLEPTGLIRQRVARRDDEATRGGDRGDVSVWCRKPAAGVKSSDGEFGVVSCSVGAFRRPARSTKPAPRNSPPASSPRRRHWCQARSFELHRLRRRLLPHLVDDRDVLVREPNL